MRLRYSNLRRLMYCIVIVATVSFAIDTLLPRAALAVPTAYQPSQSDTTTRSSSDDLPTCLVLASSIGYSSEVLRQSLAPLDDVFDFEFVEWATITAGEPDKAGQNRAVGLVDIVKACERVRQETGKDKVWLFGHDAGGMVAIKYAATYPSACRGLILVGTCPDYGDSRKSWIGHLTLEAFDRNPEFAEAYEAGQKVVSIKSARERQVAFIAYLPSFFYDKRDLERVRPWFADNIIGSHEWHVVRDTLQDWDVSKELGQVTVPTIVIAGGFDRMSPLVEVQRTHFGIQNSKLIVLKNASYFSWIELPQRCFPLVRAALAAFGEP